MMKRTVLILAALLALLLSGCCQHQWIGADCEAPEVCANCQETQGTPLGHDWTAATCKQAETCTNCGATQGAPLGHDWAAATCVQAETCAHCAATQGEALGHQYDGIWTVLENGEEMSQSCTVCGHAQATALDWCTYLAGMLQGRWVEESCFTGLSFDSSQYYYYNYAPPAPGGFELMWIQPNCLEFSPDGRVRILSTGSIEEGTYAIETREMDSGTVYDVEITTDGSEPKYIMSFTNYFYRDADGSVHDWEPEGYDHNWYMYDVPPDSGFRYSVMGEFFPDLNGFYPDAVEADRLAMLVVDSGMFVYTKQDLTTPVAQAYSLPVGTWESGDQQSSGKYTLTFSEVSTFTMTGDIQISGRYRVANYTWNPYTGGSYRYPLQLDDTTVYYGGDAYLRFDGSAEGKALAPYMMLYLYRQDGKEPTVLKQLLPAGEYPQDADIAGNMEEMYQKLSGHWQLREENRSNSSASRISTEESTLDISADGTLTLTLQEPVSGTGDTSLNEYYFSFGNQNPVLHYCVSLPAEFPYACSELIFYQKADGTDEISLSMTSAEGISHQLYFSKAE